MVLFDAALEDKHGHSLADSCSFRAFVATYVGQYLDSIF